MACPYFTPTKPLTDTPPMGRVRPPLGVLYEGVCRIGPETATPCDGVVEQGCNFGYAGALCDRLSRNTGPDAVRFSITGDDGRRVRILFTVEKNHLPETHGRLVYDRKKTDWEDIETRTVLHEQARAYVKSYLSSTDRAAAATV